MVSTRIRVVLKYYFTKLAPMFSRVTYSKRPVLNVYAHILMGVVAILGINQSPFRDKSSMQEYKAAIGVKGNESVVRTLEERRAVLGCFLISSG